MNKELTEKQKKLFNFYTAKENRRVLPPTLKVCAEYMGNKSTDTIVKALNAIERKGYKTK